MPGGHAPGDAAAGGGGAGTGPATARVAPGIAQYESPRATGARFVPGA